MPRANRYFLPGYIWHITHRCHKIIFLLNFSKDRESWISWLFDEHFIKCPVYIDLKMVRAGVVTHQEKCSHGGHQETLQPPKRYKIIDTSSLMEIVGVQDIETSSNASTMVER
jgi:hypothetical protein